MIEVIRTGNFCSSIRPFKTSSKDSFTQRDSKMELALVIFSAISAISTAILALILLQIQKSLNTNAKKRTESDTDIYKQLEYLLERNQAIEHKLVELIDAHKKSIDKVYELLRGSGDLQIGRLQAIVDTLEALKNSLEESVRF